MASFHDHANMPGINMSWWYAPTPPPTPTEKLLKITHPQQELKSSNFWEQQSVIETITALDILYKSQLPLPNDHIFDVNTPTSHSSKSSRPKPIQLALQTESQNIKYDKFLKEKHDKNTMDSDDDGENDVTEPSDINTATPESSLCQTLYPYDTETIQNGVHYTQATGSPFPTHLNEVGIDYYEPMEEQLEGSVSASHSKPVRTASLFTSQFPKIEYLAIINDDSQPQPQIKPQLQAQVSGLLTPPNPPNLYLSSDKESPTVDTYYGDSERRTPLTPETVLEAMAAFPDTDVEAFQSRRKPPPKQLYNKYQPFKQRDSVLKGTIWD